jgi:serine/threonine protein kinase
MSTPALELKGELQSLPDDDELGSYIVDGLLNTTGSSCIWRGHHCDTGEAVAIKVILYDLDEADARTAVADLRNEIEVLRGLSHPGIVKVLHASPVAR